MEWKHGAGIADDIAWLNSIGESKWGWEPRPGVFEDDIWVLHPMYEDLEPNLRKVSQGDRVSWAEVWRRNGVELGEGMEYPPSVNWIIGPGASVQSEGVFAHERLFLPEEDSMDAVTMADLLPRLPGGTGTVRAIWDLLDAMRLPGEWSFEGGYPAEPIGVCASLSDIIAVTANADGHLHTPNNFWPEDRSWLVLTAHDLWATQVFGSTELIASLEKAADLETLRWSPPA